MKTNSWAIAVTSKNESIDNLTFSISTLVKAKVWGEWSRNFSLARSGPYLGECCTQFLFRSAALIFLVLLEDDVENKTANQTLFIRRIALRSDIPFKKKAFAPTQAPRSFLQQLQAMLIPEDDC